MSEKEREENPYTTPEGGPQVLKSVVVYLDILGYKNDLETACRTGRQQELLISLRKAFDQAFKPLQGREDHHYFPPGWVTKVFTDNIVIGYPIQTDAEFEMGHLFFEVGLFQMEMIKAGFFVRGGMAIGDLYMDDEIVFGDGLIEAYETERQLARDPRIVLSRSAGDRVRDHLKYYGAVPKRSPQYRDLLRDADGQLFINYLDNILMAEGEAGPFYKTLHEHRLMVERKLEEFESQPPIWSKYFWVANYHNYFCEQSPQYFNDSHKIDISKFRLRLGRIV